MQTHYAKVYGENFPETGLVSGRGGKDSGQSSEDGEGGGYTGVRELFKGFIVDSF